MHNVLKTTHNAVTDHRADTYKLSNDPMFVEKVYDIVGLYVNPRDGGRVLRG
jgi:hypothetical protein